MAKELEHVEHYLKLLKDRVDQFEIPKIILQPLVENSLLHGFKDNAYDSYHIQVTSAWVEPDWLMLTVEDTALGAAWNRNKLINWRA